MGAGNELAFAPPSFHAIQRTVDLVREDASHLFRAIQTENPYAREARAELLRTLQAIHEALAGSGGPEPDLAGPPDAGAHSPALLEAREQIDALDRELVELLARRIHLGLRAGRAKAALGVPVLATGREAVMLSERRDWASAAGLDPDQAEAVFQAILRASRSSQGSWERV